MGKSIENLAAYFDIPAETLPSVSKFTVTGGNIITIENYRSIREFSDDLIEIDCGKQIIRLRGSGFAIEKINNDEAKITGTLMYAELE